VAGRQREDRIAFRYATPSGEVTAAANPNGSLDNIAGVLNEGRNVLGMMPHPDRSSEALLGSADGFPIFQSMVQALSGVTPSGNAILGAIAAGIAE
jgi:phosphoribosylformylglycinamidine (FGAM) synthase-like amidotransferase family enzyme